MPTNLALIDLISPYVLRSQDIGTWRPILAVMFVDHYETAADDSGVVIEGVARFSAKSLPFFDPKNAILGGTPLGDPPATSPPPTEPVHPKDDPARRDPWIDLQDAHIEFRLVAPRQASQIVAGGLTGVAATGAFAPTAAVLTALDTTPTDAPPSDYPSTAFTLDMLLTTVVLRMPFLRGARLDADGVLIPDPDHDRVGISLPRLKLRLAQGSNTGDQLTLDLLSAGASGLDDPADPSVAELITMDPPYAFIGTSNVVGFGFRSAVLDLSDAVTPPSVLAKFGFDESWKGLYLPEVRLFVAPHGMRGLALDAGAKDLLIGIGEHAGVSGDFDLEVIQTGGTPAVSARFLAADGQSYGITGLGTGTAIATLPDRTKMVVDTDGGRGPFTVAVGFGSDTTTTTGRVHDIDLRDAPTGRGPSVNLFIKITDTSSPPKVTEFRITAVRQATPVPPDPAAAPVGPVPPAAVATTSITGTGSTTTQPALVIAGQTDSTVTLTLDPPDAHTRWTIGANPVAGESATTTINLAPAQNTTVTATRPAYSGGDKLVCYFLPDHPFPDEEGGAAATSFGYSQNPANTHTTPAVDGDQAIGFEPGGTDVLIAFAPVLDRLANKSDLAIEGFDDQADNGEANPAYPEGLAGRRAIGFSALIEKAYPGKFHFIPSVHTGPTGTPTGKRNLDWRAEATVPLTALPPNTVGTTTNGTLTRPAISAPPPPPKARDEAPPAPPPPSWFRKAGVKVRIVRDTFVAIEVFGSIDYKTAAEQALKKGDPKIAELPEFTALGKNPADGIIDFRVLVSVDDASQAVTVSAQLGADPADTDGLFLTGSLPGANNPAPQNLGRDVLGLFALFTPLLSSVAPSSPLDGDIAALAIDAAISAIPFTLAGFHLLKVERVIIYGGELVIKQRTTGPEVSLLFDIETAISADVKLGTTTLLQIPVDAPLVVRYKAIGLRLGYTPPETRFQFRPVFDSSKGYTIDVSKPGAIKAPGPLGEILQVLASRLARTNPLTLDIDLGLKVDLGVISVDRFGVRIPLDGKGNLQLTALGAGVDIPGVLRGRGYLEVKENGFFGAIDITIVPIKLRVAAELKLEHLPADGGKPATIAVIATITVEFPVAIPLASSGLGIYGFLGLFAMHFSRNEALVPTGNLSPALAWLKATGGEPTKLQFWKVDRDRWAFGVGALMGSMEGGTLINLKGMLLLELPGPRILLFMKAKIIQAKPKLKGNTEGNLLAVIDIDADRGTLTIGLVADYTVEPVLKVRIPVEAFFNFKDGTDWHLFLGKFDDPVQATILGVFDGSAYLMISGNGIAAHKGLPPVTGFAIALGVHASIVWGSVPIGLYLRVTADVDVTVGFTPFHLAGIMKLRGELRLFIISISASAELSVDIARKQLPLQDGQTEPTETTAYLIKGEVCGEIDLFFFTISGCVHFEVGTAEKPPGPAPAPLMNGLSLMSRTPALVVGTATDRPVDGSIGTAIESASKPADNDPKLPVVPIDAIPVLLMSAPPVLNDPNPKTDPQSPTSLVVLGNPQAAPAAGAPQSGFTQRGDDLFRYDLKTVELIGPLTGGATPATWWTLQAPVKDNVNAALALLSWVPTPAPNAIERSVELEQTITDRWGEACIAAAPPAPVFYSFAGQQLGPTPTGWTLQGTPWPDPPGTVRSAPLSTTLHLRERWRSGDAFADQLRGVMPGVLLDVPVPCGPGAAPTAPSAAPAAAAATPTLTSIQAAAAAGQPVGRADFSAVLLGQYQPVIPPNPGLGCMSRLLTAPYYDKFDISPLGRAGFEDVLHEHWAATGYQPGPLCNGIELETGRFSHLAVLTMVFDRDLDDMRCAAVNFDGSVNQIVQGAPITAPNQLPAQWTDPKGPASSVVLPLFDPLVGTTSLHNYTPVLFEFTDLGNAVVSIELGIRRDTDEIRRDNPIYLVVGAEMVARTETERFAYDGQAIENDQNVLAAALGTDSGSNAILKPATTYQVKATWTAVSAKGTSEKPTKVQPVPDPGKKLPTVTQSFWFRTDTAAPARLDPWVLTTRPADGEQHVFTGEALQLAFATTDVMRLYAEYGKTLQVRLRAASFRTPEMNAGGAEHPFPLGEHTDVTTGGILTPWEETVELLLAGKCIPVEFNRARHSKVSIGLPLDPLTEYVMDVEQVPLTGGGAGVSVLRRTFTTSKFLHSADYAGTFQSVKVAHRFAAPGALQKIGTDFAGVDPAGSQFDDALRAAGVEPLAVPDFPRILVFWQQQGSSPPQPAAVLVDGPEPMWRSRPVPRPVPVPPARTERWEMLDTPWLRLEQGAGSDPVLDRIVRAPGGQRALVTLKPAARGARLVLALRQIAFPDVFLDGPGAADTVSTVIDLRFARAPWEEN